MQIDTVVTQSAGHCCYGVQEVENRLYDEVSSVNAAAMKTRSFHVTAEAGVQEKTTDLTSCHSVSDHEQ